MEFALVDGKEELAFKLAHRKHTCVCAKCKKPVQAHCSDEQLVGDYWRHVDASPDCDLSAITWPGEQPAGYSYGLTRPAGDRNWVYPGPDRLPPPVSPGTIAEFQKWYRSWLYQLQHLSPGEHRRWRERYDSHTYELQCEQEADTARTEQIRAYNTVHGNKPLQELE